MDAVEMTGELVSRRMSGLYGLYELLRDSPE